MNAKPRLRGVSHEIAVSAAALAAAALFFRSRGAAATWGALIYGATLVNLYVCSALYHRPHWGPRIRPWLRRLDHVGIYLLIGGTATALAVAGLEGGDRAALLWTIWIAAAVGVIKSLAWIRAPKALVAVLYVLLTSAAAPFIPALARAAGPFNTGLLALGCGVYVAGAAVYALRRPDPFPAIFGYHEIFHALVIVASGLQYAAIYRMMGVV